MAQDPDVARVAAALKAPGIRYRNFGNTPVRRPLQPVAPAADPRPEAAPAAGLAAPAPHEAPAGPAARPPDPVTLLPGFASLASLLPGLSGPAAAPPAAGPVPPTPSHAGPGLPPAAFGQVAAEPTREGYRLLESIGRLAGRPGAAAAWPDPLAPGPDRAPPATTLQSLGRQEAPAFAPPAFTSPAFAPPAFAPSGQAAAAPPPPGHWPDPAPASAPPPATMVTLPLAELMRLVAATAPTAR